MSNDKKKPAALPPKVAQFMKEAPAELKRIPELEKRAAAADTAEAKVAQLEKKAADQAAGLAQQHQKLAQDSAEALKAHGLILNDGDLQKFATDLADPVKAHNLIRHLGKKLAAAEASAAVKPMGNPDHVGKGPKTAEEGESANDRFANRVRAAAGV